MTLMLLYLELLLPEEKACMQSHEWMAYSNLNGLTQKIEHRRLIREPLNFKACRREPFRRQAASYRSKITAEDQQGCSGSHSAWHGGRLPALPAPGDYRQGRRCGGEGGAVPTAAVQGQAGLGGQARRVVSPESCYLP